MTVTRAVRRIGSLADAAAARAALARVAADGDAPALPRARFLSALTARLRRCLDEGGEWTLLLHLHAPAAGQDGRLDVRLRPARRTRPRPGEDEPAPVPARRREDEPTPASAQPGEDEPEPVPARRREDGPAPASARPGEDEPVLTCPLRRPVARDSLRGGMPAAEALLRADEDTAAVLGALDQQEQVVRLYREELHHTNQGVLALHAELDAAALAQRELLDAERAAHEAAERARRLLTFLADASAAVTASLSHTDVLRCLSELLVPDYARHIDVWIFEEEADEQRPRGSEQHSAAAVVAARTGRPQHAAPHAGGLPGVDDLPPSALSPDRALLAIPLVAQRTMGVVTLTAPGARFDADTSVMLVELARRAGVALDNARRYEQHRDTAEALQRAQLTDLPTQPGLLLAARYLPATGGMNIGGDWYDAFRQPDGSLLAVIGDVTGHGLRAAVVMGQLRTALRAYAIEAGDSPGRILTRLHRMLRHLQPDLYATALIARFRPGETRVVWASAGHPPAVARTADGAVRTLDAKPGVMLGIPVPYEYPDHAVDLPPGSSLVLYTDGLVERRALGIDPGIDRLVRAVAGLRAPDLEEDVEAAADSLLRPLMADCEGNDDVCLMLCHVLASARDGHRGARPAAALARGAAPPRERPRPRDGHRAAVQGRPR
jgi:serine phosphatase RsbU (regulator of sigma subunit)